MNRELEILKQENESLRCENNSLKKIIKNIKLCIPLENNIVWSPWQRKLEEFKRNTMQHRCECKEIDLDFTTITMFIKILDKLNVPLINYISYDVDEERYYFILEWDNTYVMINELPITTTSGYYTYSDSQTRKVLKVSDNIPFEQLALEINNLLSS